MLWGESMTECIAYPNSSPCPGPRRRPGCLRLSCRLLREPHHGLLSWRYCVKKTVVTDQTKTDWVYWVQQVFFLIIINSWLTPHIKSKKISILKHPKFSCVDLLQMQEVQCICNKLWAIKSVCLEMLVLCEINLDISQERVLSHLE